MSCPLPLEVIWTNPPAQAGLFRGGCSGPGLDNCWISSMMETPQPFWATCGSAQPLAHWKSISRCSEETSCVSVSASGSVTGHHSEEPGSFFFTSYPQVFVDIDKIPLSLLFSKLKSPNFSLSSTLPHIFSLTLPFKRLCLKTEKTKLCENKIVMQKSNIPVMNEIKCFTVNLVTV